MKYDRSTSADDSVRFSALLLLALLVVFSPTLEGGTTHVAVMIIRLMILLLVGFCLLISLRQGAMMRPRLVLDRPVVTFIALAFLSMMLSSNRHQSRQWFMVVSFYTVLLYLIVFFVDRWKYVMWLLGVVTAMGLGESVLALAQYSVFGILRPGGTFFNPNFLAGYLAAIFILLFGFGVYARRRPQHNAEQTTRHLHAEKDFGRAYSCLQNVLQVDSPVGNNSESAACRCDGNGIPRWSSFSCGRCNICGYCALSV